jgi:hypothetical protein
MIIVRLSGGMGNQMFQYALGQTLALKHGVELKLDAELLLNRVRWPGNQSKSVPFRNYDLEIFNVSAELAHRSEIPALHRLYLTGVSKLALDRLRCRLIPNPGREKSFAFDPAILKLGRQAYLEGYWQSPKYFDEIADRIRGDFALKHAMSDKALKLQAGICSGNSVCINVRRTDFVESSVHGTFGMKFYEQGIRVIAEKAKIDWIYIFSDDVRWCEEHLAFDYRSTVVGHEFAGPKFGDYLYLMASCRHFVIPNSSFAWWAAWLNTDPQKIVVAPQRWFLNEGINTDDLCPKGWFRI